MCCFLLEWVDKIGFLHHHPQRGLKNRDMNHTQGKWIIDTMNDGINGNGKIMNGFYCSIRSLPTRDSWFICAVHDSADSHHLEGETETLANAKLIAAAPELLEACKAMLQAFKDAPKEWLMTNDVQQAESIMIDAVNYAEHITQLNKPTTND